MKLSKIVTILLFFGIFEMVVSTPGVYAYPVSAGEYITINFTGGPRFSNGGPFMINGVTDPTVSFLTLCLETNEFFTPGVPYYIGSITPTAIAGGSGGPHPDPIDTKTAYLYYHFMTDPAAQAEWSAYQEAVWYIEQEYAGPLSAGAQALYLDAVANANGSLYGVGVLNMKTGPVGSNVQDFLTIPEPGILILLGIAMSAIGAASWRLRKL